LLSGAENESFKKVAERSRSKLSIPLFCIRLLSGAENESFKKVAERSRSKLFDQKWTIK